MINNDRVIEIKPPLAGTISKFAFQDQPPYSVISSLNFWPLDFVNNHFSFATRPQLVDLNPQPGGSGAVNMMSPVNGVAVGKPTESIVVAKGSDVYWYNGTVWVAATGAQASNIPVNQQILSQTFLQQTFITNPSGKPFVFDYPLGTVVLMVETAGTIPNGLNMWASWQGCLVGAGDPLQPNVLYISRTGDAYDWDFSAPIEDEGGAFFTGGENEGLINGHITGIITLSEDHLLVSTIEGLELFSGHPRRGGIASHISSSFMLGPTAWARGPDGTVYFLSNRGLMAIAPTNNPTAVLVSADKIPGNFGFLKDSNSLGNRDIVCVYEPRFNGIVMTQRGSEANAWFYDLTAGGLFEMAYESANDYPYVGTENTTDDITVPIYGTPNGIRHFARAATDDGEVFNAEAYIGPIRLAPSLMEQGIITSFYLAQGQFTNNVNSTHATIMLGTGADAYDSYVSVFNPSGLFARNTSFNANTLNLRYHPRITGNACTIKITSTFVGNIQRFVFDAAAMTVRPAGMNRKTREPQVI